jgi:hypothetical protein
MIGPFSCVYGGTLDFDLPVGLALGKVGWGNLALAHLPNRLPSSYDHLPENPQRQRGERRKPGLQEALRIFDAVLGGVGTVDRQAIQSRQPDLELNSCCPDLKRR